MKIDRKIGSSEFSSAGTRKPHWNMYCTMPVVFRQTDLPPALGPRNDQQMLVPVELHIERHDLPALRAKRLRQQRVAGPAEHESVVGRHDGLSAAVLHGPADLRPHHVHLGR